MRSGVLFFVTLVAACGSGSSKSAGPAPAAPRQQAAAPAPEEAARSFAPPPERARRPRFKPADEERTGLQALPDGKLAEWEGAGASFVPFGPPLASARSCSGEADLSGKLALAAYRGGLSLALTLRDDQHRPAKVAAALQRSDHVEVELWPGERPSGAPGSLRERAMGIRFRLGTLRQLVQVIQPAGAWREAALSSFGEITPEGYVVEARLPLSVLTPLPAPRIDAVRYRITIHDADQSEAEGGEQTAEATLRAEGVARLDPPMEVPEAVQRRPSIRVCMAAEPDALWGYENGWRCSVPYEEVPETEDDLQPVSSVRLGHSILLTPPTLVWIRERMVLVNLAGVNRGVAALLDKKDTILSVTRLGVIGALDPGSTWVKDSDAEPIKLPDGTFAVAVTHAYRARSLVRGGRCSAGQKVFLSILALRGALISTPFEPAPDPVTPPYLEEVFRTSLEDCEGSSASDWTLSRDHRTIRVHSSLYPTRPALTYTYDNVQYRRAIR